MGYLLTYTYKWLVYWGVQPTDPNLWLYTFLEHPSSWKQLTLPPLLTLLGIGWPNFWWVWFRVWSRKLTGWHGLFFFLLMYPFWYQQLATSWKMSETFFGAKQVLIGRCELFSFWRVGIHLYYIYIYYKSHKVPLLIHQGCWSWDQWLVSAIIADL